MSSKLGLLIEPKLLKIVRLFLNNEKELFNLDTISKRSKVPLGTTFRLISKVVECGLADVRVVGKTKLYQTNQGAARKFRMLK